jgi:protein SCO1/2
MAPVDPVAAEARVAALVDQVRRDPAQRDLLVALLPERSPLYAGLSSNATTRVRGYLLAAFEQAGLPEAALPYVLEELESGCEPYLVAAAARALRGRPRRTGDAVPYLLAAIDNIRDHDDAVCLDHYRPRWPAQGWTTATQELLATFAWLGAEAAPARARLAALGEVPGAISGPARATLNAILAGLAAPAADCCATEPECSDCCGAGPGSCGCDAADGPGDIPPGLGVTTGRDAPVPLTVPLEDQDGRPLTFGEFFTGLPSVVAFFYTRCDNPNKCSLTVTKLARLHHGLRRAGSAGQVRTAAITYDPEFDLPPRLRAYGENRGVVFDDHHRFLRTTTGLAPLHDYFDLGVGYGPALVNRHRIELFILDHNAHITTTFARLQWAVQEVLNHVLTAAPPRLG